MELLRKTLLLFILSAQAAMGAGSWNGISPTALNGVAFTAWNGTSISFASGDGGGGVFASDTFTGSDGTDLTAHTGEVGATWAKVTGITGIMKITSNRAKGDSGGISLYYASGSPAGVEYDVEADLLSITHVDRTGVGGRMSTIANTGYFVVYDSVSNSWELLQVIAGTETVLGSYGQFLAEDGTTTYHIKLQIKDATKKVFIDSVERISDSSNVITSAGKAGVRSENSDWGFGTTGRPLGNFTATNQ